MNKSEQTKKIKRVMRGIVVSSKMDKSIVVRVDYRMQHPVFKKFITRSKKIQAHDEENTAQAGDYVAIESCRPVSKNKRFKLIQIIKKAPQVESVGV